MSTAERAPILLTPGPLTTSYRTRRAMMVDWGSWDSDFNELTASVCQRLLKIVGGEGSHTCVPLQGSGTFAVEAAIGTLVPRDGKVLVLINGAYGKRLAKICEVLQRPFSTFETEENVPTTAADVERLLAADPAISHVALIHCETSTGILNPLEAIAKVVERHGKRLIVDAMSSFGAIGIDARKVPFDALIAASGKCLEGVPGWASSSPAAPPWKPAPATATPGHGPAGPARLYAQDRAVALHPADPCGRRPARSAQPVRRGGRPAGASAALREQLRNAARRDGPGSVSAASCRRKSRRRSSLPSTRRAIRATASPTSTNACGRRASSSIRAS